MTTDYAAFYQALELSPGAAPEEVKRAYFRLVRKYSPETHPEEFKRIRQAYDALKDGPPETEEPPFPPPTDPFLQTALEVCATHVQARDYKAASAAYESLLAVKPDEPLVLLSLANVQRLAGHPQKAAKTALRLAELYPDSRDAWRIAAMETYSRGWYKKSLPLFRKAHGLGVKRLDFLTDYAAAAMDNGEYEESDRMNREILKTEKWTKDNVEYAAEAYYHLARRAFRKEDALWLLDSYAAFLPGCRRLPLDMDDLLAPVGAVFYRRERHLSDFDLYQRADRCLALIEKLRRKDSDALLEQMRLRLMMMAQNKDARFQDEAWSVLAQAVCVGKSVFSEEDDPEVREFALLDGELCVLKEDPDDFRQDAGLVESDYPYLAEKLRDFLEEARTGDRDALFDRLKRRYLKLYYKFESSNFQKRYPEEVPSPYHGTVIHSGDAPYVRGGKKVGRNDPCPCGSGKKFKRCCMGKGIYD